MYNLLPCIFFAAEATYIAAKLSDQKKGMMMRMIIAWKQLSPLLVFCVTFAMSYYSFLDLAHFAESAATLQLELCRLASLAAIVVAACTASGHLITRWSLKTEEVEQDVVEEEGQGADGDSGEEENEDIEPIRRGPGC